MNPETSDLVFQAKDMLCKDNYERRVEDDDDSDRSYDGGAVKKQPGKFTMYIFGSTESGQSVTLTVHNFRPFFYVQIPNAVAKNDVCLKAFRRWILEGVSEESVATVKLDIEQHKTLIDYNGEALSWFMKISTGSQQVWRGLKDRFLDKASVSKVWEIASLFGIGAIPLLRTNDGSYARLSGTNIALNVYEANIDPMLRFFHIQDVSPSGWIKVCAGNWDHDDANVARTTIRAVADATDIKPGPVGCVAPFTVASWDIECNSAHGDFPIAKKTWRKPLRELLEGGLYDTVDGLCDQLASAIRGKGAPTSARRAEVGIAPNPTNVGLGGALSPIFLKNAGLAASYSGETLRALLDSNGATVETDKQIRALRAAGKGEYDAALAALDKTLTKVLPAVAGDEIIQIGTVMYCKGVAESKHIWVLGPAGCDRVVDGDAVKPPGADVPIHVYPFKNEGDMLKSWFRWIGRTNPDVMIGYNIFGFDSQYIYERLEETVGKAAMKEVIAPLSCLKSRPPRLEEKFLSSSAMGDNTMYFMSSPGRLQIDLLPYIRRNHNLDSYSLDNVSATFVSGGISGSMKDLGDGTMKFSTKSTKGTVVGRFITLLDEENDRVIDRCEVVGVEPKALIVRVTADELAEHGLSPVRWAQVKDDVSPKDIFRMYRGTAADRAIVARYCLQDCDLVMELFNKLEILNNSIAMADVCSVPVSFIFLRGQGIKIESLIFKECRRADQLILVLPSQPRGEVEAIGDNEEGGGEDTYEGAIVLDPHTGIYIDDPVTADDFASLYPSSIISENISHDTLISVKDYDNDGKFICIQEGSDKYDNLPGLRYVNIEFDILRPDPADTRKHPEKICFGRRVARYVQNNQGTIPRILEMLLANRKKCRKQAESETDDFRKALLDAQQLAYKLTANSLYGQLGSGTFKIRRQVLAASTTAYGRKQLMYAKSVIEECYGGGKDPRCDVECVYGDTDSIFLRFRPKDPVTGERLRGRAALQAAKDLTVESGKLVTSCLKPPHDFEFDKIFKSFILLSKKRYVGDMSEDGIEDDDFHRKSMGIVMKRRDNAPIVKYVYGGAIERILTNMDVDAGVRDAAAFVQGAATDLLAGKFPMTKLTITKSLRAEYADPSRIAHKVLADRIAERDPGNKPSTSDRIPFVYIKTKTDVKLQGDRIETPAYIREKGLMPDYSFYITNQIAKPVSQVFGLALESLTGLRSTEIEGCKKARDPVAARESLAESYLFEKVLAVANRAPAAMEAKGQKSIASFFGPRKS
jgi:DNA polymerase elongation subunit (family B)